MKQAIWVCALAAAACGSKTTSTTTTNTTTTTAGTHVKLDLNGDGTADTATLANGVVTAAGATFQVPTTFEAESVEVIDLGDQAVIAISNVVTEDDLQWLVLRWNAGQLESAGEAFLGSRTGNELPGDGTIRVSTGNCGQSTELTYRLDGGKLVKEEKTTGTFTEDQCSACPYVFVETAAGRVFAGESLRNLVGPARAGEDALVLPVVSEGQREVVVVLAEVKAETTYLDALALEFDGVRVAPSQGPAAAVMADGAPTVIDLGQRQRFVFDVPAGFSGRPILHARGYYLPR